MTARVNSLKTASLTFEDNTNLDEYENVVVMDKVVRPSLATTISAPKEGRVYLFLVIEEKNEEFICHVCKRKFPTQEKLKMHEEMSALHKVS